MANSCDDPKADGGGLDLTGVSLRRNGSNLEVTWSVTTSEISSGTAGFYVNVASADGSAADQLGVKYLDGRQVGYFVSGEANVNVAGEAARSKRTIMGLFPMNELQRYGRNFKWSATTTRDGNDMDACPDPGSDVLNPKS
jgi:hypothetical protein